MNIGSVRKLQSFGRLRGRQEHVPVEKHREFVLQHRLDQVWSELHIFWMSLVSDFIKEIMINFLRR